MKYSETSYLMKKRLAEALETLLVQKSFPEITVRDIVELCGVNRKTFYYHFSDIHALLCWLFHERFSVLMQTQHERTDYVVLANGIMDYVEQNEKVFLHLVDTVGEDSLKRALGEDIRVLQDRVLGGFETCYGVCLEEDFRAFFVKFLSDALVGSLMDWIRGREYRNRENTILYLRDIFRAAIPGLIDQKLHLKIEK